MRLGFCTAMAALLSVSAASIGRADPILTTGIGLSSCAKLGPDLKPGAGLNHLPNALLFYWTQGYISAANIFLLNKYTDYIDAGAFAEPAVTQAVFDFCKSKPDGKPISAIDGMIRSAEKIAAKKSDAFDLWEHTSPVAATAEKPPAATAAVTPVPAAPAADDTKRVAACVSDNKDEGAPRGVVMKYCSCMSGKMGAAESASVTQWEDAHATERKACDRESGWK